MKKLLFILVILTTTLKGQIIFQSFDSTSNWNFTNGAGIQYYPNNYYGSTNINDTAYLNNSEISITSPEYQFECDNVLTVEFPLFGRIEATDTLFFEYKENGQWFKKDWFTGIKDITPTYNFNPTATQFRFRLLTDGIKLDTTEINGVMVEYDVSNSYVTRVGTNREILVYYYDIDYFKVDCGTPLAINLISFSGINYGEFNRLEWITATQTNNQWFALYISSDAVKWSLIDYFEGEGYSNQIMEYAFDHYYVNGQYYKLESIDSNGLITSSDIIVVYGGTSKTKKLIKTINLMGQDVSNDYSGTRILIYNDGSFIKVYQNFSY